MLFHYPVLLICAPMAHVESARWRFDLAKKADSVKVKDPLGMEKVEGDTSVVRMAAMASARCLARVCRLSLTAFHSPSSTPLRLLTYP